MIPVNPYLLKSSYEFVFVVTLKNNKYLRQHPVTKECKEVDLIEDATCFATRKNAEEALRLFKDRLWGTVLSHNLARLCHTVFGSKP